MGESQLEIAYDRAGQRNERTRQRRAIDGDGLEITRTADSHVHVESIGVAGSDRTAAGARHVATLLPHGSHAASSALLLLPGASGDEGLLLNGLPPLAVTELTDAAEISLGEQTLYVHATAGGTAAETFAAGEHEECARCKRALTRGALVRRCGTCASAHHEGPTGDPKLGDLWCASYDVKCGRCGAPLGAAAAPEDDHRGG
jgi:hypothetical protein